MAQDLIIRSTSTEFLIFDRQIHKSGIEVRFEKGDLWLTQKAISELYDIDRTVITKHLKNIFEDYELDKNSVCAIFAHTAKDNKTYKTNYYNLDAVISVGYRANSDRAIQFRRWATNILKEFSKKGYIIDKKRMENGTFFDEDYFETLLAEIREIRLSERRFYQKITDIYATSMDYDSKSPTTIKFFKKVQNKMHFAVAHQTAAEIIYNRADSDKEHMNLTSWKNSPNGKILETDVVIAKNYLKKEELEGLELIVSSFLDLAESRAKRNIPMSMEDWSKLLDKYLLLDDRDILKDAGKISHEIACDKALTEFEKYRIKQDKLYKSDFDLLIEESNKKEQQFMKYYFINHGFMGSNIENWFPWFKEKIDNGKRLCIIPQYPIDKKHHFYDEWEKVMSVYNNFDMINEDTVIIGHSTGSIFSLKYIIKNKVRINKLILISGFNNYFSNDKEDFHNIIHPTYFLTDNNLKDIKKYANEVICIYGNNDPYITQNVLHDFAQKLNAKEIIINNGGHLNKEAGYTAFDEILKYVD